MKRTRKLPWAWIVVGLGDDQNLWVEELSDRGYENEEPLSIMDPRQVRHVIGQLESYRPDGYARKQFERAFHAWRVNGQLSDGRLRLVPAEGSFFSEGAGLFALPDMPLDLQEELEQTGCYPEFLEQLERMRIRHLNRTHHYVHALDEFEMEEELRTADMDRYVSGHVAHVFEEICEILEWGPGEWDDNEEG